MTQRAWIVLAAGGSAGLLLAAFAFQYIGGLYPCSLCLWQRWPHAAAVVLGVLALASGSRALCWLGALGALTSAGIGMFHTGVERGWWEGPSTCSGADIGTLSTDELMAQIMSAPVVRCDDVAWELLGLSMASWNVVASLVLVVLWVMAALARD